MNFEEHSAKPLLASCGIEIPRGCLAVTPADAAVIAQSMGKCVVKAQVPIGQRGKAGGIRLADTPIAARNHAEDILGMTIGEHVVSSVLVEQRFNVVQELYAAVVNDMESKGPLVLFSAQGGMNIEEVAGGIPTKVKSCPVDIRTGLSAADAAAIVSNVGIEVHESAIAAALVRLYEAYTYYDAELLEVNPLAITEDDRILALDCKYVIDDSAIKRHEALARQGVQEKLTPLEALGQAQRIKYIELDGDIGVLANGAGLTMTTMDVIRNLGGSPANFCEIGGEAYTMAKFALEIVLSKSGLRSLVVNFCGAFARCDVMMKGFLEAWDELKPEIPVFFSVAGTGDDVALAMLKESLGIAPMADMNVACREAVRAAECRR